MKPKKIEYMIPSWANAKGEAFYGAHSYGAYGSSDSTKIYFRGIDSDSGWSTTEARALLNICLYVWFDADRSVCVDLRLCDIHTMTLNEAEYHVKLLKKLKTKVAKKGVQLDNFYRNVEAGELSSIFINLCAALGIKRTVQYHGINTTDTYAPVEGVISFIVNHILERRSNLR